MESLEKGQGLRIDAELFLLPLTTCMTQFDSSEQEGDEAFPLCHIALHDTPPYTQTVFNLHMDDGRHARTYDKQKEEEQLLAQVEVAPCRSCTKELQLQPPQMASVADNGGEVVACDNSLPAELWLQILDYALYDCTLQEQLRLTLVCGQWQALIYSYFFDRRILFHKGANNNNNIDERLKHMASSPVLREIAFQYFDFSQCGDLTRAGLQYLGCFAGSLKVVNLGSYVLDRDLKYLKPLRALKSLSVQRINTLGVKYISKIAAHLKILKFTRCFFDDEALQLLESFSASLTVLNLLRCNNITDAGIRYLSALHHLEDLFLRHCKKIGDGALHHVINIASLQALNLHHCSQITDDGMRVLSQWESGVCNLQFLSLERCCRITDKSIPYLMKITSLQTLNLGRCHRVSDAGMLHLSRAQSKQDSYSDHDAEEANFTRPFISLRNLSLFCGNITNSGMQHISYLSSLQLLLLDFCDHIDISHLASLKNLQSLYFGCTDITDEKVSQLSCLSHLRLQTLALRWCDKVTNEGIRSITCLTSLRTLKMFNCRDADDEGIGHLGELSRLEKLHLLNFVRVTNEGIQEIRSLTCLHVSNCGHITDDILHSMPFLTTLKRDGITLLRR